MSEEKRFSPGAVLKNLFFPPRCLLCGKLTPWGETLCPACRKRMGKGTLRREETVFGCDRVLWAEDYAGDFRLAMERFKFSGEMAGRAFFGEMLCRVLRESGLAQEVTGITFVPMPPARKRARGYNQAELLAEYLSQETGIPLFRELLTREGRAATHEVKNPEKRRLLTEKSYHAGKALLPRDAAVLLVDDIVTTGATLTACARLLREKGAAKVYGAAPLRTPAPKEK